MPVPRGKQRALLAILLLRARQVVPLDELAETLWGVSPPPSARVSIQNHVMRLRRSLADAGSRIRTQPPGYLIHAHDSELDVSRFQVHAGAARAAARDLSWDTAAAQARAALALWRGEPLADVDSEALLLRESPRLAEMRLQVLETRIDADLHLGRHTEVITELRQLTASHPLRERLHGLLMLALYRDGHQAEALVAYQRARQILVEELGTDPGAELISLHQQILTGDDALATQGPAPGAAVEARPVVPCELPAAVRHFAGRERELTTLTALIGRDGGEPPGTVVISAIGGTAGVGKTALAVHWAHRFAGRFPDGQLYVNLRGYDPGPPVPASDALAGFLRALGVPGQAIPAGQDERAARYRSLLAGRRVLVVLDNARSAEHVRSLLPGTPTCVVVVTSRDSLAGLVARDGAVRLDLDVLPLPEAISLLRALIGPRVDAEPGAAAVLAGQCCRLPLALRVAAEHAVAHPAESLAELTGELADQRRRLDLLDAGADPHTAVRAVFSWSCEHLDPAAARAFRLLGLHPGPDLDSYAAAALTGTTLDQVGQLLDLLIRAHLIQSAGSGRYAMHDLLRAYARDLTASHDTDDERNAALTRLFDHYLHTAAEAMDAVFPVERHRRPRIPRPGTPIPPLASPAAAREWLDRDRAALVASAAHSAGHGWPGHATRLSSILARYLDNGGHYSEAIPIHNHALKAARDTGDTAAEAYALKELGAVDDAQGRFHQSIVHLDRALALFGEVGDLAGEAISLNILGMVHLALGLYPQGAVHLQRSLDLHRKTEDKRGQIIALGNLGVAERRQGNPVEAAGHYHEAQALCRETGDRSGLAMTLVRLGVLNLQQDLLERAAEQFQGALSIFRDIGERSGEADTLSCLADLNLRQGRFQQAADEFQQALPIQRDFGDQAGVATSFNGMGEASIGMGRPADSSRLHAAALEVAAQIGAKDEEARAHAGLARGYRATGALHQVRRHWQQALAIYTEIGAPEAGQIRAEFAAADAGVGG